MPGIGFVSSLLLGAAVMIALVRVEPIGDLSPMEAALLVGFGGIALVMAGTIIDGFRRHWTYGVQSIAVSGGILVALLVIHASRGEWQAVLDRAIGDISYGRTVVTTEGEVVAARRSDGSFIVAGKVNGRDTRFIFDTGASTVVLRAESAEALGIDPEALDYSIPVSTANGTALAAPVTIGSISVGPITERNVRALIAREGVLHANLLGMTFLERLASFEVRGNRLILRAKGDVSAGDD
ncbi:retropepsin-like aspartic protease family protein [Microvirga lenta]|uniref:retropepsin-like aspartic protease family protein n=1 Tax=Microvirga lenta TaxID=2881337 RepID=UPI001CFFFE80|nr:TIGR02281 family clan AA aspartic protease [Microvirga lenta]MCB5176242.1 TIGR02281 family clan AA aspartic protease [Microvirga lenta]